MYLDAVLTAMCLKQRDANSTQRLESVCCWASMPGIKTEMNSLSGYIELKVEEEPVSNRQRSHTSEKTSGMEQTAADESVVSSPTPEELTLRRSTCVRQEPHRYIHNLALPSMK